ncbi:serine/threonine-protein kinase [Microtetraspora niveoalba]|uniref:serine/threonine-protein kinase n=1 Tax=Microtetraspora niveoalba TaxID=46175 RepID=UPI0008307311|nr:serine/threonine-protein kinase [Microtetraspora niveoalba]
MEEAGAPLLPGYELLGVLGQGGFGVVYRARQLAVGREVALKLDNRVLLSDRDRRRFLREVTAAGALSGHPHVAGVYDAGVLPDGRPYMVLELCPGGSLADRLKTYGPLGAAEVRDIGIKIADALSAAHATGVLHRDVKPANILVNAYGLVVLSDFGLATMPGTGSGEHASVTRESLTPAFAPPEAFELTEPTAAGDVYALSATLYALLNGRPPRFPEGGVVNIAAILALHRLPVPDIPGVPSALLEVLRHGMARDPRERVASAADLRDALSALAPDGTAPGPGLPASLRHAPPPAESTGPHAAGSRAGARPDTAPPHTPPGTAAAAARIPMDTGPSRAFPGTTPPSARTPMDTGPSRAFPGTTPPSARTPMDTGPSRAFPGTAAPRATPGIAGPHAGASRDAVATRPRNRTLRHSAVFAATAAVFATLLVTGLVLLAPHDSDGSGAGAAPASTASSSPTTRPGADGTTGSAGSTGPGGFEVATYTAGCPAAESASAGAACVSTPECWAGTVSIGGDTTARAIPCGKPHTWETFAIAPLPAGLTTDQRTVEKHPTVTLLCSKYILLLSRRGAATTVKADRWEITVLPPSAAKYATGLRSYRCLGRVDGRDSSGSGFGRSARPSPSRSPAAAPAAPPAPVTGAYGTARPGRRADSR